MRAKNLADQVIALDAEYAALSDQELVNYSDEIIAYVADNNPLDDKLIEALCIIREVVYRVHNKKLFSPNYWRDHCLLW